MARRVALEAEVVRCPDDALAKVVQPEPVDQHACGQRILRVGDPAGELESPVSGFASRRRWLEGFFQGGNSGEEAGLDNLGRPVAVSLDQQVDGIRPANHLNCHPQNRHETPLFPHLVGK